MISEYPTISIVVPCYNEAENIPLIIKELQHQLFSYNLEIILVDDGSSDGSEKIYKPLVQKHKELEFIRFSRNFGHQAALMAGIEHAVGNVIITIDADLQQPPDLIPDMINKWEQGYKIVEAIPIYINSIGLFKKYTSKLYYRILNVISDFPVVKGANDYRLIDRSVAEVLKILPENHLYLRGLYSWMGYKKGFVDYVHLKRKHGKTHYPLHKMTKLALNGITSLSIKPLRLALVMGIIVSIIAFIVMGWALYLDFFTEKALHGWTSTIISTVFLAGVQLIVIGILGEYLGKLFIENKRRPNFIIEEKSLKR